MHFQCINKQKLELWSKRHAHMQRRQVQCLISHYRSHTPMNLPVFVKVLQALQHFLQNGSDASLIQHAVLVLPAGDDMFDDVQHRA